MKITKEVKYLLELDAHEADTIRDALKLATNQNGTLLQRPAVLLHGDLSDMIDNV